ncbi:hypothetical protein DdX_16088 [Ditylenchus destructor]|uniref:Uncharacterized protein n=1 Tax=Ditylenchus destructor TaxID=166010 RepID=A0AAD4R0D8_9BILA|nr:hypothetical protein DdX_16088 [Ditylenchus destructor]
MTSHQGTSKTPDYDPKRNSSFINFLLRSGIDGGFKKGAVICSSDADESSIYSKTITLAQFPLYSEQSRRGFGIASILLGLLGIAAIVAAQLSLLSLYITIPVAVISILFCVLTGVAVIQAPKAHHRYVFVELECKTCNEGHTVIYDAITVMKRRRFGYYTNPLCVTLKVSSAERTYEFIESAFEEMPNHLASNPFVPGAYDCQDWADDLTGRFLNVVSLFYNSMDVLVYVCNIVMYKK